MGKWKVFEVVIRRQRHRADESEAGARTVSCHFPCYARSGHVG